MAENRKVINRSANWIIADTHFNHANILKYCHRPFPDIKEHDAKMTETWNQCIKPDDIVYHLGDFCFGGYDDFNRILNRLNGRIILIKGNHDKISSENRNRFFKFYDESLFVKINDKEFYLSHYAHRVWPKSHYGVYHLYGHSHGTLPDDPFSLSFDVGVDCFPYRPVNFNEIIELMEKKEYNMKISKQRAEHGVYG